MIPENGNIPFFLLFLRFQKKNFFPANTSEPLLQRLFRVHFISSKKLALKINELLHARPFRLFQ